MIPEKILLDIISLDFNYIVIETIFTRHHIERTNYQDRGKIKWIAETKHIAFDHMNSDEEARNSHIDNADLFPRLYFLPHSFIEEFIMWLNARNLRITNAEHK